MFVRVSTLLSIALLVLSSFSHATEYIVKQRTFNTKSLKTIGPLSVLDQHSVGRLHKVEVSEKSQSRVLQALMQDPNIEYIVPNFKLYAFRAPLNLVSLRQQWANKKVQAEQAWAIAGNKGSRNVSVAVIDTGIDYRHESLASNMVPGYDFRDNDADPMDETSTQNPGHGTHCAGSLAGSGLVEGGVEGLSPIVTLMPLRFLGKDGSGDLMAGIKAIDFAIEKGVQIISASWGATVPRSQAAPLIEAIQRADDAGVIFIAAASNDGRSNDRTDVFPANAGTANMIAVAASGAEDEKPSWSNYGKATVSLAAPGLDIMSSLPNDNYGNLSGTSMATPLVAGLVALLKGQDSSLTGQQIRSLLQVTGTDAPIETACNCRVNAAAAMDTLINKKMWVFPAAATIKPGATLQFNAKNAVGGLEFSSSNPSVATIDAQGLLTAKTNGETMITAKDSRGQISKSKTIYVSESGGGGGGGNPGECPFPDPTLCEVMCQIQPTLPWCQK